MEKIDNLYRKLFISTFYLSAFTFGGGYVIVPLMKEKFVEDLKWIEEKEMLDLVAIGQSSPGPIAVNTSIIIGYRMAGLKGALCTITGTILPPLIIISLISLFYEAFRSNQIVAAALKGMQGGVSAVIVEAVYKMAMGVFKEKKISQLIIMLVAFILAFVLKVNVILIIVAAILIGVMKK